VNQRWMVIAGVILVIVVAFVAIGRHKNDSGGATKETSAPSASSGDAKNFTMRATKLEADGRSPMPKAAYQKLVSDYPDSDQMESTQSIWAI